MWDGNGHLAKDLFEWSGVGGEGEGVMQFEYRTWLKDGTHLLIATNPTSAKIPCAYVSERKAWPFREDLIIGFNIGCILCIMSCGSQPHLKEGVRFII